MATIELSRVEASAGKGTKVHNLTTNRDSGKKGWVEFRAQCEVWLSESDARIVEQAIMPGSGRTSESLEEAEELVVKAIPSDASEGFVAGVRLAFWDLRRSDAKAKGK